MHPPPHMSLGRLLPLEPLARGFWGSRFFCAPTVLALAPASVMLADGGAPAVFTLAPLSAVLADGGAPAGLARSALGCARRWRRPRSLYTCSSLCCVGTCFAAASPWPSSPSPVSGTSRPLPSPPAAPPSPRHSRHLHRCLPCRHLPSLLPPSPLLHLS
jgi:hypothetical protein